MSAITDAIDLFHEHLDGCEQCRNHPFELCSSGAELLRNVGRLERIARSRNASTDDGRRSVSPDPARGSAL
jgi:hypothetical protein